MVANVVLKVQGAVASPFHQSKARFHRAIPKLTVAVQPPILSLLPRGKSGFLSLIFLHTA
jgi:hypothetical protein